MKTIQILMSDAALIVDSVTAIVAFFGFCLFLYWWIRAGKATSVFVYVTFLLIVISYEKALSFIVHFSFVKDQVTYEKLWCTMMNSSIWDYKGLCTMLVLIILVSHMCLRAIKTASSNKEEKKWMQH